MQQPFDQQVPHPGSGSPDQSAQQQGSEALLECTYVADSRTALRLSRVIELDRWRSPRTWAIVAALPLVVMARHIFELVTGAGRSDTGPLGLLGAYLALLIPAAIIVALITGVRMMKKNPLVTAYSSAGLPMRVRYGRTAMEVSLTTSDTTIDYTGVKGVTFFGGAAMIRRDFGPGIALPGELVPASALARIREVRTQGSASATSTSAPSLGASTPLPDSPSSWTPPPISVGEPRHRRVDPSRDRTIGLIGIAAGVVFVVLIAVTLVATGNHEKSPITSGALENTETIAVPPGPYGYVAVDPVARVLYIANGNRDSADPAALSAVDIATKKVLATVPITANPRAITVDSGIHAVYVVSAPNERDNDGVLTVFSAATNAVVATVPTKKNSVSVAVDPVTHIAYVNNSTDSAVDPKVGNYAASSLSSVPYGSNSVAATIPTGMYSNGIAIVPESGVAFVTSSDKSVKIVDLAKNSLVRSIPLSINASMLVFDPGVNKVFAADKKGMIAVIDPVSMTVNGIIDGLGQEIDAVAFDSEVHTLYIASFQDSRIRAIDTLTQSITASMDSPSPSSLAVDPKSHAIYSFGTSKVTVIHR